VQQEPQPASGAAVVAGGAVEAGPVEGSVPLLGATAAIWHLKPPAFFFLFERNWNFKVRALLEAGRVSPNPAA